MRPTLSLAVLMLAIAPALAYPLDCYAEPHAPECAGFRVDDTAVLLELGAMCKPAISTSDVTGWPAACTLLHECQAGGTLEEEYCAPLTLMLTACSHSPELAGCAKYNTLCSPLSVVQQCSECQRIASLPTATQLYLDALTMCSANPTAPECARCNAGLTGPDQVGPQVGIQSVTASCPNPLGAVSQLCLSGEHTAGCEGWDAFCSSTMYAFPALCLESGWAGADPPAPAPAPTPSAAVAAVAPAPGPTDAGMLAGPDTKMRLAPLDPLNARATPDCYAAPGNPACVAFRQPDEISVEQLGELCAAMPAMIGCTLWASCKNGSASGRFCAPFSLLGDICAADMPTMHGCEGYTSLCANASSVVAQCTAEGPVQHVLLSDDTTQAILRMCSTHGMPQCSQCPTRYRCPDPMTTISGMCLDMPTMSDCAGFVAMCEEAGGTFMELCGDISGDGGPTLPPMKMYLHQSVSDIILLKAWVPRSTGAYAGSCIAVLLMGLLVQALKAWRMLVEMRWSRERAAAACLCTAPPAGPHRHAAGEGKEEVGSARWSDASGMDVPLLDRRGRLMMMNRGQARRNAVRGAFTVVIVLLDYLLMLIVMTFNVGIISAAVLGFGAGALLFGHISEQRGQLQEGAGGMPLVPGALLGPPDPDPENSLEANMEAQYVEQQHSCCSGH